MKEKILSSIQKICDIVEVIIAIAVGLGLLYSLIIYIPFGAELLAQTADTDNFLMFLEDMFNFVIGIEFIKMLCKPSAHNVIETLVFLTARHMIVGVHSALDIFLSVLSVALLYGVRLLLSVMRRKTCLAEDEKKKIPPEEI